MTVTRADVDRIDVYRRSHGMGQSDYDALGHLLDWCRRCMVDDVDVERHAFVGQAGDRVDGVGAACAKCGRAPGGIVHDVAADGFGDDGFVEVDAAYERARRAFLLGVVYAGGAREALRYIEAGEVLDGSL